MILRSVDRVAYTVNYSAFAFSRCTCNTCKVSNLSLMRIVKTVNSRYRTQRLTFRAAFAAAWREAQGGASPQVSRASCLFWSRFLFPCERRIWEPTSLCLRHEPRKTQKYGHALTWIYFQYTDAGAQNDRPSEMHRRWALWYFEDDIGLGAEQRWWMRVGL